MYKTDNVIFRIIVINVKKIKITSCTWSHNRGLRLSKLNLTEFFSWLWWQGNVMIISQCTVLEFSGTLSRWYDIRFWLSSSGNSSKKLHCGNVVYMSYQEDRTRYPYIFSISLTAICYKENKGRRYTLAKTNSLLV